jgi:hypothetical protein
MTPECEHIPPCNTNSLRLLKADPVDHTWLYSKRLLSLAAQKFVNDIASDAFHYAKLRMNAPSTKTGKAGTKVSPFHIDRENGSPLIQVMLFDDAAL